jgi:hypothetical protein
MDSPTEREKRRDWERRFPGCNGEHADTNDDALVRDVQALLKKLDWHYSEEEIRAAITSLRNTPVEERSPRVRELMERAGEEIDRVLKAKEQNNEQQDQK